MCWKKFTKSKKYRQKVIQDIIDGNMQEPNQLALTYRSQSHYFADRAVNLEFCPHPHPRVVRFYVELRYDHQKRAHIALKVACELGHLDVIKDYLFPDFPMLDRTPLLSISIAHKQTHVIEYLMTRGIVPLWRDVFTACEHGCLFVVERFFTKHILTATRDDFSCFSRAFRNACFEGHVDVAKLLISKAPMSSIRCDGVLEDVSARKRAGLDILKYVCDLLIQGTIVDTKSKWCIPFGITATCFLDYKLSHFKDKPFFGADAYECPFLVGWLKGIIVPGGYPELTDDPYFDQNLGMVVSLYVD